MALATFSFHPPPPDPPPALPWDEVMRRAAEVPSVRALEEAAAEKRALDRGISGLGNPELSILAGSRFGANSNRGFDGEFSVLQPIPLAPVGEGRREAAGAESRLLEAQAALQVLDNRLAAAEAFCNLYGAEKALLEADRKVSLSQELLSKMEEGRKAGAFTSLDVATTRAYVARSRLERLDVEGEVFDRGIDLARVLASERGAPLRTDGVLPPISLPRRERWEDFLSSLEYLPARLVQRLDLQTRSAKVREREIEGKAFTLGVGGTVLQEGPKDHAVLGTVRLTVPLFERNLRERGSLGAERRIAEGDLAQGGAQARSYLISLFHEVDHAEEIYRVAMDELLPAAEESARLSGISFAEGQTTLLELLVARETLSDVRAQVHRAEADRALARARLSLVLAALTTESQE